MRYPVKLTPDGKFVMVSFPDVPEALTQGNNREDALRHGSDVLEAAIEHYVEAKQPVPMPSRVKRGQDAISLPPSLSAKVLLLDAMFTQKVRPSDLASRLQVTRPEVTRLLDLHHTTKIDGIARALAVLGKTLEVRVI